MAASRVLFITLGALISAAGCDRRKVQLSTSDIREIQAEFPGITESCLNKVRVGGIQAMPDRTDACFRMEGPRRWKGLWRDEFEGQRFCSFPARLCSYAEPGENIWLTFGSGEQAEAGRPSDHVYAVEFIRRRTAVPGHYGHLGSFRHEVVVDQLISISALP
jgi:hypothetical protein